MEKDVIIEGWQHIKNDIKGWWGKLTDHDLLHIDGKIDNLLRTLQEKYGWNKQQAIREMNKCFNSYMKFL